MADWRQKIELTERHTGHGLSYRRLPTMPTGMSPPPPPKRATLAPYWQPSETKRRHARSHNQHILGPSPQALGYTNGLAPWASGPVLWPTQAQDGLYRH